MIANVLIGSAAAIVAAVYWDDRVQQYWVGMNVMLAFWCLCNLIKECLSL